jgi:broad specificity phosphatase PhoE
VLRVILCDALGMDLNRALSWRLDHASLSLLRWHNGQVTLLAGNIMPQDESLAQRLEVLSDRR